jgi:D-beta-D-heptose 7-phosphate kinase/D-beta-D-heptose 1-phosphate adenosyltransferase
MYEKLLKTVTNLGSPKVLVVGDVMLDTYVYGDALRISPEAPVPILKIRNTEHSCGGAASVVNDLCVLGARPFCIGVIGDDQNGKTLRDLLTKAGADITGLLTVTDRPTISKQRLVGLAQHRHQQQLFRMDEESTEPFSDEQCDKILQNYRSILKQVEVICLQDYNKGMLSAAMCRQMIQLAKKAGKKVLVDPCLTSDYSKYVGASLITPNRNEASAAVGFEITNPQTAARAAEKLYDMLKLEAAVITLDREGAYLKTSTISESVSTRPRNVYDVTGAGDMVLATLAITLAAGCDYQTAVQLANITGGIEVEKFGVATVSIEEIINELVSQNKGKRGKVLPLELLTEALNWHRRQKETVVFTNGCFDVVHRGHIEFLKFCKSHGDILVLGLNSDNSVKILKGPDRPINNQLDRAAVLAALETVDYVTIFDEPDPLNLITKLRPDVLVKGQDWADKGVIGREFVESCGGKVVLAPIVEGKSSTATIEKMKSLGENS